MQALRDSNLALGAKDLEWQRRIAGPRSVPGLSQPLDTSPSLTFDFFARPQVTSASYPTNNPASAGSCGSDGPSVCPTPMSTRRESSPLSSEPSSCGDSGSSHGALPDSDAGERRRGDGCRQGRIGKIRRHRMTKEEEARFDPVDLKDLRGSTAAKSRKMTEEERDIMLHKRRLRNRQSAARSRDKQRKTISDVGEEVDKLLSITQALKERCESMQVEMGRLKSINDALKKENVDLQKAGANANLKTSSSFLTVSMSSDMLDKIIGGEALVSGGGTLRMPNKLHLSVSTDKLAATDPCSSQLPPLPRNSSILERLLDIAGGADLVTSDPTPYDSMNANSSSDTTASF